MAKDHRTIEEAFRDLVRDEFSGESRERTLEEIFQETLDQTTPEKSGDVRDRKNKDIVKKHNYWI